MSKSWPLVSLGELLRLERRPVTVVLDNQYAEIGIYCFGRGIFHKMPRTGLEVGNKDLFLIKEGDFILQVTFAWEGAVALASKAEDGMFGSTRFPTYRVDESRCFAPYLVNYFKTLGGKEQLVKISPGSAGRNRVLSLKRIPEVKVPLPPLDEQRRIVARIEGLGTKIKEARRIRQQAVEEVEALLASARNHVFGSDVQPDWIPLSSYVSHIENGKSPATEGRPASAGEWAVLKVGAVSFGSFDEKENKALPLSFTPIPRFEVQSGDFLMSRANTAELVGACALVKDVRPKLMLSDKIFRFVLQEPRRIDLNYLNHALKSPVLRSQIVKAASGTSPTMKNISKSKVLALRLPDVSFSDQRRIVVYLDGFQTKIDSLKRLQAETAIELDAMIPSILDKAFQGGFI